MDPLFILFHFSYDSLSHSKEVGEETKTANTFAKIHARLMFVYWVVVSKMLCFHPQFGKIPILTNIFQRDWFNHQLGFTYCWHRWHSTDVLGVGTQPNADYLTWWNSRGNSSENTVTLMCNI